MDVSGFVILGQVWDGKGVSECFSDIYPSLVLASILISTYIKNRYAGFEFFFSSCFLKSSYSAGFRSKCGNFGCDCGGWSYKEKGQGKYKGRFQFTALDCRACLISDFLETGERNNLAELA